MGVATADARHAREGEVIDAEGLVWLGEEDVSKAIRFPEIGQAASKFAAVPAVRSALLDLQRRLGRACDSILDGRDIGTVVFPDAEVKIYLTASSEVRAERRMKELKERGIEAQFETVLAEIIERDHADMTREIAPLKQAEDAILVDASNLTLNEVVDRCAEIVAKAR